MRIHVGYRLTTFLAAMINQAKPRAPMPAAMPRAIAPTRSAKINGGAPCTGNSGVTSFTATKAR